MRKLFVPAVLFAFFLVQFQTLNAQDYFQQEVNYKIDVRLDDSLHLLNAFEEIEYVNNSPDQLSFLYFHIWPNAYENNETALAEQKFEFGRKIKLFRIEGQRGYIDSLDFKANGETVKWEYDPVHIDICKIFLNKPLAPGGSIMISTPFRVKIPKGNISRLGHIDQAYAMTQWYPKPAVYDKYGWHQMPYLNMGEFYSEFGSFDVSISLPKNYVVGATGNLQNEDELNWLNEKAKETAAIRDFDLEDADFPESDKEFKTLRYTESNIHDFAWFADKRFHVLKEEVELPHSGRRVTTWAMFPNKNADLWKNANEYINDALYYYSLWYGDYPYDNCSAIHAPLSAGGGMEYPTITVIGNNKTAMGLEMVIMHEVGHNWFYGMIGTDEREHPWLDEGINSFSDRRYMMTKYPDNHLYKMAFVNGSLAKLLGIETLQYNYYPYFMYLANARHNLDQPLNLATGQYSNFNYGAMVYSKSSVTFAYMHKYLGDEKFNEIMQDYFEQWKFKHPYPDDLQKIFESHLDEDLSWFFDDLLKTTKKLDYKISKYKDGQILIKNRREISSPVLLSGLSNDSVLFTTAYPGFTGKKWLPVKDVESVDAFRLDQGLDSPELYTGNNWIRTKGMFKKTRPFDLNLIGLLEDPYHTNINLLPAFGYNYYDKFMIGGLLYNSLLPLPALEYQLMPMYSFGTKSLAGMGNLRYNIIPEGPLFQMVSVFASGMQFGYADKSGSYYQKLKFGIDFRLKRKVMKKHLDQSVELNFTYATDMETLVLGEEKDFKPYYDVKYHMTNKRKINPYGLSVELQASDDFVKANMEARYEYTYIYSKSLQVRFFGGAFLHKSDALSNLYSYTLSGSSGINDYKYDQLYFARFEDPAGENVLAKQFAVNDGGFSTYSALGQTNDWILSLNLNSSLPIPKEIPIRVYASLAFVGSPVKVEGFVNNDSFYWEMGAKLSIVKDVFEIYFPITMSDPLQDYSDEVNSNYWNQIRFTLYLNKLNPFKLAREL